MIAIVGLRTAEGDARRLFAFGDTAGGAGDGAAAIVADCLAAVASAEGFDRSGFTACIAEANLGAGAADTVAGLLGSNAGALAANLAAGAACAAGSAIVLVCLIGGGGIDTLAAAGDLRWGAFAFPATG